MRFFAKNKDKLFGIYFNCLFIGIAGWITETIFCSIYYNRLQDRGFLILPFCPIYAAAMLIYFAVGIVPSKNVKGFFTSWLVISLAATAYEGISGLALSAMGISLWDYREAIPLSLEHISLPISLLWGLISTLYIYYVIPLVTYISCKIKVSFQKPLMIITAVILFADFCVSVLLVILHGGYYPLY